MKAKLTKVKRIGRNVHPSAFWICPRNLPRWKVIELIHREKPASQGLDFRGLVYDPKTGIVVTT